MTSETFRGLNFSSMRMVLNVDLVLLLPHMVIWNWGRCKVCESGEEGVLCCVESPAIGKTQDTSLSNTHSFQSSCSANKPVPPPSHVKTLVTNRYERFKRWSWIKTFFLSFPFPFFSFFPSLYFYNIN